MVCIVAEGKARNQKVAGRSSRVKSRDLFQSLLSLRPVQVYLNSHPTATGMQQAHNRSQVRYGYVLYHFKFPSQSVGKVYSYDRGSKQSLQYCKRVACSMDQVGRQEDFLAGYSDFLDSFRGFLRVFVLTASVEHHPSQPCSSLPFPSLWTPDLTFGDSPTDWRRSANHKSGGVKKSPKMKLPATLSASMSRHLYNAA
jgi:hypothetical protein